jgi:hypothetical protein
MKLAATTLLVALLLAPGAGASALGAPPPRGSSEAARAATADALAAALQADEARALRALRGVPAREFQGGDATLRACLLARFGQDGPRPAAPGEGFPARVLSAYRRYWRRALLRPAAREAEEERLRAELAALLGPVEAGAALDDLEPLLAERLRREGLHAQLGRTSPLRELMLWAREDVQRREVALPEGAYQVEVHVLDGFRSLGWGDWATCGEYGAGGWADEEALYLVRPRYRTLDDDDFRVSFLAHETQHLADRRRWAGLPAWELEYRAKLTELALASDAPGGRAALLVRLEGDQGDDPEVPHAFADRRVLADLRARLGLAPGADLAAAPGPAVREAARAALREDTARRGEGVGRRQ